MTRLADRARASVSRLTAGDCPEWLAFRARNFGAEARQTDPGWLAWQAANPELRDGLPDAWISRRDGAIVGSQGAIPVRLVEAGRTVGGSWAVDLMVDPEWRLRGVGPALTDAQARDAEIAGAVRISDAAYRAYLRAGWLDLGGIPHLVRAHDVRWALEELGWRGARAILARMAATLGLAASRVLARALARTSGSRLVPVTRFDERVEELWAAASRSYPVIATRDARALAWRFDAVPDAARLLRWYLVQGRRVRGYVVARLERRRGRNVLEIVDYLATPAWMSVLLAQVIATSEARTASAVSLWTLSPGNELAFLSMGFVRVDGDRLRDQRAPAPGTAYRFMIHRGDGADRPAYHRRRWFLTAGDSDMALGD